MKHECQQKKFDHRKALWHKLTTSMKRPLKKQVIRARCEPSLKEQIERVAYLQQLDPADIIRVACAQYVHRFQKMAMPEFASTQETARVA